MSDEEERRAPKMAFATSDGLTIGDEVPDGIRGITAALNEREMAIISVIGISAMLQHDYTSVIEGARTPYIHNRDNTQGDLMASSLLRSLSAFGMTEEEWNKMSTLHTMMVVAHGDEENVFDWDITEVTE
jgi:hypothetical protein